MRDTHSVPQYTAIHSNKYTMTMSNNIINFNLIIIKTLIKYNHYIKIKLATHFILFIKITYYV